MTGSREWAAPLQSLQTRGPLTTQRRHPSVYNRAELLAQGAQRPNTSSYPTERQRERESTSARGSVHDGVPRHVPALFSFSRGDYNSPNARPPSWPQGGAGSAGEGSGCGVGPGHLILVLPQHLFPVSSSGTLSFPWEI